MQQYTQPRRESVSDRALSMAIRVFPGTSLKVPPYIANTSQ
jgi:hypothetical protein